MSEPQSPLVRPRSKGLARGSEETGRQDQQPRRGHPGVACPRIELNVCTQQEGGLSSEASMTGGFVHSGFVGKKKKVFPVVGFFGI